MSLIPLGFWAASGAGGGAGAYDLLETQILSSSASSVTFTGLDTLAAGYQHLQLRATARATSATFPELHMRFNGDTGSNYANHQLRGTGSVVNSESQTSQSRIRIGNAAQTTTSSAFYGVVLDALDFSLTTKNTTIRALTGYTANGYDDVRLISGAWFNTNAVTSIQIYASGTNLATGSRFSLYGVK